MTIVEAPRPRPSNRLKIGKAIRVLLVLALAAFMASAAAASASWLDTLLLGAAAFVLAGFALLFATGFGVRSRSKPLVLLTLVCSPMTVYPLGALIALRFLLFPADGLQQGAGIAGGLLMLSPIILILAVALLFVTSRRQ